MPAPRSFSDFFIRPAHGLVHPALCFPRSPLLIAYAHTMPPFGFLSILAKASVRQRCGSALPHASRRFGAASLDRRRSPKNGPCILSARDPPFAAPHGGYKLRSGQQPEPQERGRPLRLNKTRSSSADGSTKSSIAETSSKQRSSLHKTTSCTTPAFLTTCTAQRA